MVTRSALRWTCWLCPTGVRYSAPRHWLADVRLHLERHAR